MHQRTTCKGAVASGSPTWQQLLCGTRSVIVRGTHSSREGRASVLLLLFSKPVFYGQRSLAGYSPWGCKELDMNEHARMHTNLYSCRATLERGKEKRRTCVDTDGSACAPDEGRHSWGTICGHSFQHPRLGLVCFRCVKDHWIYKNFSSFSHENAYMLSSVWLCDSTDCSPPGSSVHGISHARILEWVVISTPRGYENSRKIYWK